jgi:hypothetical protein
MNKFIFKQYQFDRDTRMASFRYGFENGIEFEERVKFANVNNGYNEQLLDRALFLSFVLIGTSYYKPFPSREVVLQDGTIDDWQAAFFNKVYQEGLSQFAFENKLARKDLAHFTATTNEVKATLVMRDEGTFALQSGGKDSLLTSTLLSERDRPFSSWYIGSTSHHPALLDTLGHPLITAERFIDSGALSVARDRGGLNGHVPITYIVASLALVDAILNNVNTILLSIGHEGEEAHDWIDDLPVNHQWSKTWPAEKELAHYVRQYISPDIRIGSPLRRFTELKIAELFVQHAWKKYGHIFSSCNRANYMQGSDNTQLKWCGECPKCANSFVLFAPFLPAKELKALYNGQDLFEKPLLQDIFKGLLGVDGVMKPFECVGEIEELRFAYHMAQAKGEYAQVSFHVPASEFNYHHEYESQQWAHRMVE